MSESRKRVAECQLGRDGGDHAEEEETTPQIADAETMRTRRPIRIKVPEAEPTGPGSAFSGVAMKGAAPAPVLSFGTAGFGTTFGDSAPAAVAASFGQSGKPLALLKKKEEEEEREIVTIDSLKQEQEAAAASEEASEEPAKKAEVPQVFGSGKFSFSFSAPPPPQQQPQSAPAAKPAQGFAEPQTPQPTVEEEITKTSDAKLWRFVEGGWRESGTGTLRFGHVRVEGQRKPRLTMVAEKTFRALLNVPVCATSKVLQKDGKTLVLTFVEAPDTPATTVLVRIQPEDMEGMMAAVKEHQK